MKVKDVTARLESEGWKQRPGKRGGSHRVYVHATKPGRVIVSDHGVNVDIPVGTLNAIKKQAGWK